jgi:polysaccharide biosynthesis transport protein
MDNEQPHSSSTSGSDESLNIRQYWQIILERRWLVITAFIAVFVLSLIYLFKATPIYQAVTRVEIDRNNDTFLKLEGMAFGAQDTDYLQTQYENLMSRTLIQSVVNQLKLDKDERYSRKGLDTVKAVADDIQIAPIRLSRLVDIKVEHSDAKTAAEIANIMARKFIDNNLDDKISASMEVVRRLQSEADAQKAKLQKAEKDLHDYAEKTGNVSFEESENIVSQALRQYQTEYAKARSEAAASQRMLEEIDGALREGAALETIPHVRNNPELQVLRKELAVLEALFAELQKRYKSKYPDYERTEARIASLKDSIHRQSETLIAAMRNNARIARSTESSIAALVKEQERELLQLKNLRIQYGVLKREAAQNDLLYTTILARMKEVDLTGRNKINNMRVVDAAVVPAQPVKPRKILTLLLGVVGGLGVAIGLAFFVNYLDDSIKSQDDVENYLRLPFLGYVPNIKTNSIIERDLQAHLHPQSNAAEGFRTVRATISLTHKPDKFRVLAVTSTIPSEGKSLVASNLAIVMAQTGLRTLLVDADLRRPSVHKAYQLHSPTGLSSYLSDEITEIEPMVHKCEVPNLDVICCGSVPANPSELIGSDRMMDFLKTVRQRYDRIILDCPPISAVSDPLVISAMSDGVVFVTKFNKIRREHVRKSVQRVQNAGIHLVGVVLNDIDFEGKDSYYYSYYYYQNRYYASHYKTKPDAPAKGRKETAAAGKSRNGSGENGHS